MIIKQIVDEDFSNYKKASMFIIFPKCSFKCEKESNMSDICQNSHIAKMQDIEISVNDLVERYLNNRITEAIVCGGLEPFDSFDDLYQFIFTLRKKYNCDDDIVIYTGYNKDEITSNLYKLTKFKNIILKYGRFIPNQEPHFDKVLGIRLISDNQYGEVLQPFKIKTIKNPELDSKEINEIKNEIKKNGGYCPCRLSKNEDTKCICKEFRDVIKDKKIETCYCGLYKTVIK